MLELQSLVGIAALVAIAWALSENRRVFEWRTVAIGIALQFALGFLILRLPAFRALFVLLNEGVALVSDATRQGTSFVLGYVGGATPPFETRPGVTTFVLAAQALPMALVVSALSAVLYHWRILPAVVKAFAWALQRTMNVGGAVGVSTAANIFVGMVEAPLLIRPYLARLSRSELFVVMVGGMAGIAGTVMVIYAQFLGGVVADPLGHLLTASVLSAPAAIAIARVMVPESGPATAEAAPLGRMYQGTMDAVTKGTVEGLQLLLNIVAMLIVLVALVYLANGLLAYLPDVAGAPLTLQRMLGEALRPLAWLIGIPWAEAGPAGALLGIKIVLNEFLAYVAFAELPYGTFSPRSKLIMTYALCGFANFGSLGIMIGGLGVMAPERRAEIVALGLKSIAAGTLASCMTGAVVGVL